MWFAGPDVGSAPPPHALQASCPGGQRKMPSASGIEGENRKSQRSGSVTMVLYLVDDRAGIENKPHLLHNHVLLVVILSTHRDEKDTDFQN